jgi:ferredoxin
MKIKVERARCSGHARCWSLAPEVFQLDDSGYILPHDIAVPKGKEEIGLRGARACPERALSVAADDE